VSWFAMRECTCPRPSAEPRRSWLTGVSHAFSRPHHSLQVLLSLTNMPCLCVALGNTQRFASNHGRPCGSKCAWDHWRGLLVHTGTLLQFQFIPRTQTAKMHCKLIPQIVINYRRHNAVGLQPTMMILWAWAGVPLGVYNIAEEFNIALRIQPQILTLLSLVTWIQCFYYQRVPMPR
jgi:hypothetical protein